jgi:oxygen-independent coproporphyrinogen-3 oxidase
VRVPRRTGAGRIGTSIGLIGQTYSQNERGPAACYALIDEDRIPVFRGVELNRDDQIRRSVIMQLICEFELAFT